MTTPRRSLLLLLMSAFVPARLSAQADSVARARSAARILADVKYLADDARQGRGVGTAGLDSSAAYIARQFQQAGLRPGEPEGYFQTFAIDTNAPALAHCGVHATRIKNVVGSDAVSRGYRPEDIPPWA